MTTGLALYEGLGPLRRLLAGVDDPEESARKSVSTAVIFDEEVDLTLADVEAIRRYGWEVARPDAYPLVMHKERGHSYRLPLAWELDLTAGCLRALPDFVARRRQDDPTPEEMTVPAASGDLKLVLSWLPEPTA
jgi:hypothetical protein